MAIAYRSGSTAGDSSGGNLTITTPAGTTDNDILIAVLYREAGTWTLPAGWTQVGSDQRDFNSQMYLTVAWKRAAGEGANYTFTLSTTTWRTIVIGAFSGCTTSGSPIDTSVGRGTNESMISSGPIATAITTTVANAMRIVAHGNFNGHAVTAGTSGMTRGAQVGGTEIWYVLQASAGDSGTMQFSGFSATDQGDWATIHLDLIPDTGGGTPTGFMTTLTGYWGV